jgi:hypothetical protein
MRAEQYVLGMFGRTAAKIDQIATGWRGNQGVETPPGSVHSRPWLKGKEL